MRYVVIMAGGSGTRLWPLSRKGTPKQLLKLIDGRSLLRLAFERAQRLVPDERILVVTGAPYLDNVAADLPELPRANLLGEPEGRDSLNAVAWPAAVLARRDPDAVIASSPPISSSSPWTPSSKPSRRRSRSRRPTLARW
jgi:mannose-1-phosphate guanylyltransferase